MTINPFLLLTFMRKELKKRGIVQHDFSALGHSLDEAGLKIDYSFFTAVNGTIEEKCRTFCNALNIAIMNAEKEMVRSGGN
jgi:hypothetical protein